MLASPRLNSARIHDGIDHDSAFARNVNGVLGLKTLVVEEENGFVRRDDAALVVLLVAGSEKGEHKYADKKNELHDKKNWWHIKQPSSASATLLRQSSLSEAPYLPPMTTDSRNTVHLLWLDSAGFALDFTCAQQLCLQIVLLLDVTPQPRICVRGFFDFERALIKP